MLLCEVIYQKELKEVEKTPKLIQIPKNVKERLEKQSELKGVSEHAYLLFALNEQLKRDEREYEEWEQQQQRE